MPTTQPKTDPAIELHQELIRTQGGKTFKLKIGELSFLELDDQHHYWLNGKYLTSVTHLLDVAGPVPWSLKDFWQRNDKDTAEAIFEKAGDFGTKMHDAFEKLLQGVELRKVDYPTLAEQKAIDCFMRWVQEAKPQDFITEQIVASKKYEYAGTLDFVATLNKAKADWLLGPKRKPFEQPEDDKPERWLIDFKTTSGIYFKHELQVAAYRQAYEESYGEKIDRMGIVRISARHKAGWEFKEVTRGIDEFMNIYDTYRNIHGGEMPEPPEIKVYPDTFKLFDEVETNSTEAQDGAKNQG